MDSNVAEVTMDTSGVMPHCLKRHGSEVIDDYGFCEVAHMTKAYAQGALHRGATAVTVVPYPGWDSIWPFLNAGLRVYVYKLSLISATQFRRVFRNWQQRARRKYGLGRLLLWPQGRAGSGCKQRERE